MVRFNFLLHDIFSEIQIYMNTLGDSLAQAASGSPPHSWGPEFASRSVHVCFMMEETESRYIF